MAIGKLLSPWFAPPPAPTARRLSRTFTNGGSSGPKWPPSLRRPPQEAERQSQPAKNRLIQGCGEVAKLLFACEPIDAVRAGALGGQHGGELGQQHRQLPRERPGRIDHDQGAGAEPAAVVWRGDAELGAPDLRHGALPQAPRQSVRRRTLLDRIPQQVGAARPFAV